MLETSSPDPAGRVVARKQPSKKKSKKSTHLGELDWVDHVVLVACAQGRHFRRCSRPVRVRRLERVLDGKRLNLEADHPRRGLLRPGKNGKKIHTNEHKEFRT